MTNTQPKPRLDARTKPRWEALFEHALESQNFCKAQGEMMNSAELRDHIAKVNRAFCFELNDHWQEVAAKCVEACTGVRISEGGAD